MRQIGAIAVDDVDLVISFRKHPLEDTVESLPEIPVALREESDGLRKHFLEYRFGLFWRVSQGKGIP